MAPRFFTMSGDLIDRDKQELGLRVYEAPLSSRDMLLDRLSHLLVLPTSFVSSIIEEWVIRIALGQTTLSDLEKRFIWKAVKHCA
jgi:hypothetical protein